MKSDAHFARDTASYRGIGMLTGLLRCGLLPEAYVDQAQRIVDEYEAANTRLQEEFNVVLQAQAEVKSKEAP